MKEPTTIERKPSLRPSLDYELLRQLGIRFAQQFSGSIWTDYNEHDPGVTIIEYLAYALTDLAYRSDFSVHELLTAQGGTDEEKRVHSFFLPDDIFSCRSLVPTDYRKMIIQRFSDVVNAWVEPDVNNLRGVAGLFNIRLQLAKNASDDIDRLKKGVRELFLQQRNLSEDLGQIIILQAHQLIIKTGIQLKADATPEFVLAHILHQLEEFLQARIQTYNLHELEDQGYSYQEIFTGPVAYEKSKDKDPNTARPQRRAKGFIRNDDLRPWVAAYNISDIREILLKIEGVQNVERLLVWKNGEAVRGDSITVDPDTYLELDPILTQTDQGAYPIQFYRGQQVVTIDLVQAEQIKNALTARSQESRQKLVDLPQLPPPSPLRRQEISAYHSIQRLLPIVYGLGEAGLPEHASLERQGQAQQLKAYLLFFEQLLANHLAQLAHLPQLFAVPQLDVSEFSQPTYFTQFPFSIPNIESLIRWPYAHPNAPKKDWNPTSWNHLLESRIDKLTTRYKTAASWKKRLRGLLEERYGHVVAKDAIERAFADTDNPAIFKKHLLNLTKHWEQLLWEPFILDQVKQATQAIDHRWERKNRLLDHLLARFGMHIPADHFKRILPNAIQGNDLPQAQLKVKSALLTAYADLSQNRGAGMNYAQAFIDDQKTGIKRYNVSGLEKRLHTLLNWDLANRPLSQLTSRSAAAKSSDTFVFPTKKSPEANLPLRPLLRYGIHASSYRIYKKGRYWHVALEYPLFRDQQTIVIYDRITQKKKAYQKREELIGQLKLINQQSVGFYVVEPLLLRPTRLRRWQLSFSLQVEGHTVEVNSRPFHDKNELQDLSNDLLIFVTRPSHYWAKTQYQVVIQQPIFISTQSWTTDSEERQALLTALSQKFEDIHHTILDNFNYYWKEKSLRIPLKGREDIVFNTPDSPSSQELEERLEFLSEQDQHNTFFNFTDDGQLVIGYTIGRVLSWQDSTEDTQTLRQALIDTCCNAPYDQPPLEEATIASNNQRIVHLEDGSQVVLQLESIGPINAHLTDTDFLLELLQQEQNYFVREGFQLFIDRRPIDPENPPSSGDLSTNVIPHSEDETSDDWVEKLVDKFKEYRDNKPAELLSTLQWKLEDFGHHDKIQQNYSHQLSLICTAWPESCQQQNFRDFFRNLVAEEIPAHVGAAFYWLSIPQMKRFEELYTEWRQQQLNRAVSSTSSAEKQYEDSLSVDEAALELIHFLASNRKSKNG